MQVDQYYRDYWEHGQGKWTAREVAVIPAEVEHIRRHVQTGNRVLDVGCGDGRLAPLIRERGAVYAGVDVSESAVRLCREKGLDVRQCDTTQIWPFPDDAFDAVTIFEVLEHLFRPDLCLAEARRVVRDGGLVIGSVPNAAVLPNRLLFAGGIFNPGGSPATSLRRPWQDAHIRFFTRSTLERLLRAEIGMADVAVTGKAFSWLAFPVAYRAHGWTRRLLDLASRPLAPLGRGWPSLFADRLYFRGTVRKSAP